ncbi:hypothetical protein K469DRAFT_565729, partial [Zopfia rhizophila CBS 207.26]
IPEGVHTFIQDGRIRASECIEPTPDGNYDGLERRTTGDWSTDTICARRLLSSWSLHWRCEEVALRLDTCNKHEIARSTVESLILVCKRMYIEVLRFTTDTRQFIFTDLGTLARIFQDAYPSCNIGTSSFPLSSFPWIRELNITLRLPLPAYETFERTRANPSCPDPTADASTTALETQAATWTQLSSSIARLKRIQSLHICLDHDDQSSWSVVNERATLSHLSLLSEVPDLAVTVTLPKLHPRFESTERHFTADSSPPWFELHRKLRQRYHGETRRGCLRVTYKADFPVLLGVPELAEKLFDKLERVERDLWRNGFNVEREFCSNFKA